MVGVVVFPALLLLVAALTQLASSGVLRMNRIAGIRLRSTLTSRDAWVAGHQAAAPWAWAGFAGSAVASVGVLLYTGVPAAVLSVVVVVIFVATIVVTMAMASRAAQAHRRDAPTRI